MTGTGTASTAAGETAEGTCDIAIAGKVYHLEQGDRDCSSAIISAFELPGLAAVAQRTPEICGHVWWELETLSGIQCHPDISRSRGMFI